jgi:hydroxymethylpyrimidine/phosphomethylpyrimidine kinase
MRAVLTVAGSDPSSGAGIQVDIRVFQSLGLHPLSAIAAITVQNSLGVKKSVPVDTSLVIEQIEALLEDFSVEWLKTGLLGSASTVEALAGLIKKRALKAVVDPVMVSTSGHALADSNTIEAVKEVLIPVATVITPNIPEAEALTDIKYEDNSSVEEICKRLKSMGPQWVVLKGGHRGPGVAEDILFDGNTVERFSSSKVEGDFHGTGCVFSSALAGYLALGSEIKEAMAKTKQYVRQAIEDAYRPAKAMAYLRV